MLSPIQLHPGHCSALKSSKSELELSTQSSARLLETPFSRTSFKRVKSCSRQNLTVTFSLDPEISNKSNNNSCYSLKPPVAKSVTTKSAKTSTNSNSNRRQSLGTSIKVLRRAATWKIRSQERLQAKRERRERRATKTLGIVLGKARFI